MKNFLLFTILLLSSFTRTNACGYSPYGEDIRFSLFYPKYFTYNDFSTFWYNTELIRYIDYENDEFYSSNIYDWYNYTHKKVPLEEINRFMNDLSFSDIDEFSENQFIKYLYQNNDVETIDYLKMAKHCESYNEFLYNDSWERDKITQIDARPLFDAIKEEIESTQSNYLKRKYAFLAMRAAYYYDGNDYVKDFFRLYFENGDKDYLYYWALYFDIFTRENISIDLANIMAYSAEKKYAVYYYFRKQFNLKEALLQAKTKEEIANCYAFASVQRLEPNLDYLKKIYENSNKSRILDFLLLREINKIEDWIYTPYYTNYLPSIEYLNSYWTRWDETKRQFNSTETLRNRSEKDRLYASQVLQFVNSVNFSKIENPVLWKSAQIQLLFMTKQFEKCLEKIKKFTKEHPDEKVIAEIEKIKVLCVISNQPQGKAIIKEEIKPFILKYCDDTRFMFAVGRELEFKGNLPDAVALISFSEKFKTNSYPQSNLTWQGNRLRKSGNLKYFYDYFDYVDYVYSANEMQKVINRLNDSFEDEFSKTIYKELIKDKTYLTDLLGTKYVREENLVEAEKVFLSLGEKYWEENYNTWERDKYGDNYVFDQNPFYDFKHTPNFIPHKEEFVVTKLSIVQHLLKYKKLAQQPDNVNCDYYYFIIANCYLNMTSWGNSWMMRRFYSTVHDFEKESYIDQEEYVSSRLAQKYYQLAYEHSKTDKFKALCIRMKGFAKNGFGLNRELEQKYPEYSEDLYGCSSLDEFFKAR